MSDHPPSDRTEPPSDLAALATWIDGHIAALEAHPDVTVGEHVAALLDGIDALHRAALGRLVDHLRGPDAGPAWAAAQGDPVVRATLLLYDLLPRTDFERAEEVLHGALPRLSAHGVTVELRSAADGVVTVRVEGRGPALTRAAATLRPIVEAALRHGFDGFRELVLELPPGPSTSRPATHATPDRTLPPKRGLPVLPARDPSRSTEPVWHEVTRLLDLPADGLLGVRVEHEAVLLVSTDGRVYAYRDACPDTPMLLSLGTLDGGTIVCPWHGCRFDGRTGQRLVHRGPGLTAFEVAVSGAMVRVSVATSRTAPLPRTVIAVNNRS